MNSITFDLPVLTRLRSKVPCGDPGGRQDLFGLWSSAGETICSNNAGQTLESSFQAAYARRLLPPPTLLVFNLTAVGFVISQHNWTHWRWFVPQSVNIRVWVLRRSLCSCMDCELKVKGSDSFDGLHTSYHTLGHFLPTLFAVILIMCLMWDKYRKGDIEGGGHHSSRSNLCNGAETCRHSCLFAGFETT